MLSVRLAMYGWDVRKFLESTKEAYELFSQTPECIHNSFLTLRQKSCFGYTLAYLYPLVMPAANVLFNI